MFFGRVDHPMNDKQTFLLQGLMDTLSRIGSRRWRFSGRRMNSESLLFPLKMIITHTTYDRRVQHVLMDITDEKRGIR